MKVLVTGGNGFVGRHVQKRLFFESDLEVFAPKKEELDVLRQNVLFDYVGKNKIDAIVHLSALCGGIGINKDKPAEFMYSNLQMGLNVANVCSWHNIKLVNTGTVCSYPKYTEIPFKEENFWNGYPEETNAAYGIAKKTVMEYTKALGDKINVTNLVPVNMCGEYDNFDLYSSHVIPALIRKFEEATTHVEIWGNGEASREFLYAGDFADAIVIALRKKTNADPINIGTGNEISIKDLVEKIKKIGNYNAKAVWLVDKPNGQPRRCLDTTNAKKILKWEAKTDLDTMLKRTIDWYRGVK
jgi:GDP-L-fucose synthase